MKTKAKKSPILIICTYALAISMATIGCGKSKEDENFTVYKDMYSAADFGPENGYSNVLFSSPEADIKMDGPTAERTFYVNAVVQDINLRKDYLSTLAMSYTVTYAKDYPSASAEEITKETNNFINDINGYVNEAATGESNNVKVWSKALSVAGEVASEIPDPRAQVAAKVLSFAGSHLSEVHTYIAGEEVQYDAQGKLAERFNGSMFNGKNIAEEYKQAAQSDKRVAHVDDLVISKRVGVSAFDSTAKIIEKKPMYDMAMTGKANLAGTVRIYEELKNSIGPDGSLTIKVDKLQEMTNSLMEDTKKSLNEEKALLVSMDTNLKGLLTIEKNRDAAAKAAAAKQAEEKTTQLGFQAAHSVVNIFSTIMKVNKVDPKAVAQFSAVAHAAVAVNEILHKFNTTSKDGGANSRYGTAIMMGDFVSLGMALVSAFSQNGPTADQMILTQLAEIHKSINELRKEMHERFDNLDRSLGEMHRDMSLSFNALVQLASSIKAQMHDFSIQIKTVGSDLANIQSRIMRIEEFVVASARLHANVQVRKIINECERPSLEAPNSLSESKLVECLLMIESLVKEYAMNPAIAVKSSSVGDINDVIQRLSKSGLDTEINLLKNIANSPEYATDEIKQIAYETLPSIEYWTLAKKFISRVINNNSKVLNASHTETINRVIDDIYEPGNHLRYFVKSIRSEKFIKKLVDAYTAELTKTFDDPNGFGDAWNQAVAKATSEYVSQQAMLTFTLTDSSGQIACPECKVQPHLAAQRELSPTIKNLLSITGLNLAESYYGVGWYGAKNHHAFKPEGNCHGIPLGKMHVSGKLNNVSYKIVEQTREIYLPDELYARIHVPFKTLDLCPEISAPQVEYYYKHGSYGTYLTGVIARQITIISKPHGQRGGGFYDMPYMDYVSPDGDKLSLEVSKLIFERALEHYQSTLLHTIGNIQSEFNKPELGAQLNRLQYRKKILEAFLNYAFPNELRNRDLLYNSLYGGQSASGLIDVQGMLTESLKDQLLFKYYMMSPELYQDEGKTEEYLNYALQQKAERNEALTPQEKKLLTNIKNVRIPKVSQAVSTKIGKANMTEAQAAFKKDNAGLNSNIVTAFAYTKDKASINPVANTKAAWVKGRTKYFTEHLLKELTSMERNEVNVFLIHIDSLSALKRMSEMATK